MATGAVLVCPHPRSARAGALAAGRAVRGRRRRAAPEGGGRHRREVPMSRITAFVWLTALALVTLYGAACAPVDAPPGKGEKAQQKAGPLIQLDAGAKVVPVGK